MRRTGAFLLALALGDAFIVNWGYTTVEE